MHEIWMRPCRVLGSGGGTLHLQILHHRVMIAKPATTPAHRKEAVIMNMNTGVDLLKVLLVEADSKQVLPK